MRLAIAAAALVALVSCLSAVSCVIIPTPPPDWSEDPCAIVRCGNGTACRPIAGRGRCVKDPNVPVVDPTPAPPPQTSSTITPCAVVKCAPGFECKNINDQARCVQDCQQIVCTADISPVCGSDGKTYSNACNLNVAACFQNKIITVADRGECKGKQKPRPPIVGRRCPISCPVLMTLVAVEPICGTDNKNYADECHLAQARCRNPNLRVKYRSRCLFEDDECGC